MNHVERQGRIQVCRTPPQGFQIPTHHSTLIPALRRILKNQLPPTKHLNSSLMWCVYKIMDFMSQASCWPWGWPCSCSEMRPLPSFPGFCRSPRLPGEPPLPIPRALLQDTPRLAGEAGNAVKSGQSYDVPLPRIIRLRLPNSSSPQGLLQVLPVSEASPNWSNPHECLLSLVSCIISLCQTF